MRYRKQDENGDYTFGRGLQNFYIDSPEAVAQAVLTRLLLERGEWFVNTQEGTPYATEILGKGTQNTYDLAIQSRILETEGVVAIVEYASVFDSDTRELAIEATIDTIYGATTVTGTL